VTLFIDQQGADRHTQAFRDIGMLPAAGLRTGGRRRNGLKSSAVEIRFEVQFHEHVPS
jgi:hypothetical protein